MAIKYIHQPVRKAPADEAYLLCDTDELLAIRLTGSHVDQFRNILQRALNCAPPHDPQYADWFALADLLEGKKEIKGESQGV